MINHLREGCDSCVAREYSSGPNTSESVYSHRQTHLDELLGEK